MQCATLLILLLSLLFVITEIQASAACNGEFEQFKNCMSNTFNSFLRSADVQTKLNEAKACFDKKSVFQDLGKSVEGCVKNKIPGFSFPDLFLRNLPGGEHSPFSLPSGQKKLSRLLHMANNPNVCPAANRQQAENCLTPIVNSAKGQIKNFINELCQAKETCSAKLTPNCKAELDNIKKNVVECACSQLEPNAQKYTDELLNCLGSGNKPPTTIKRIIEGLIPKFCQRMRQNADICQNMRSLISGTRALQG
ncbi:protein asteroid [Trichinella spiralis]|uniref:protein asteroid n=1 Tax=Trichinella spiralis TaxID=6334 RepID=UPI0001EFB9C5|nr:protein asteroid [Trichinella spiralis]